MFKPFTRLICLIVCFQLAWGCNSSQVSVTGASVSSGNFFGVQGTIVQTLKRVNDLIFPSAMAQGVTGRVVVYDYTDSENVVEIASQVLDGSSNKYSIQLPKNVIEDRLIQVVFLNPGQTDKREKIADSRGYTNSMVVDLDANTTLVAALVKQEIKDSGETEPEAVREVVNKFDPKIFQEMIKKAKGSSSDFTNPLIDAKAVELLYQLKNGDIDSDEFKASFVILKDEAKTAAILGGRVDCSGAQVTVKESAYFRGTLLFYTDDEETTKALNISKLQIGKISSAAQGNSLLLDFYGKLSDLAGSQDIILRGAFKLEDIDNKINSTCQFTVKPPPPVAFTDKFDNFYVDDYGKVEEAIGDLDKMYADAIARLDKDYSNAKIDYKSGEGKVQYQEQVQVLDDLYNDLVTEAMNYFIFGVKKEEAKK